jgi:hypothetical protein
VQCTQAGTIGNVPSYTIRRAVQNTPVMGDIYNASRFFTGAPEESKEERKKRFSTFVRGIARATPDALTYGCLQVTNVAGVYHTGRYRDGICICTMLMVTLQTR